MDEATIAAKLQNSIPEDSVFTKADPIEPGTPGVATPAIDIELDEYTQYKLHDYFGEPYRPNDEVAKQQLRYIYEKVSERIGSQEYGLILAKMREMEQIIGTSHTERRMYRLYQWLKLDNVRRDIDLQMGALSDG
jgi:hypothetical protein